MLLNDKQRNFIELCYKEFGDIKEITRAQLVEVEKKHKVSFPQWLVSNKDLKLKKGLFKMPSGSDTDVSKPTTMEKVVKPTTEKEAAYIVSTLTDNVVPNKDKNFVSFGNFPDVKSIIKDIKQHGDDKVIQFAKDFDKIIYNGSFVFLFAITFDNNKCYDMA